MVKEQYLPNHTRDEGVSSQNQMKIIVAVDFGTTYSSVAYATTLNPSVQKLLTDWGDGGEFTEDKIPTVLRYDNDGSTGAYMWGYNAREWVDKGKRIHEWFKLGLCNNFEGRRAKESELIRNYKSQTALPEVKGEKCMDLVVNYLSSIKGAVDKFFMDQDEVVAQCPRHYIVTVPALWDHAEQDKTRQCAERADMGEGSQLQIIPEPEAACIYAIQEMLWMKQGDTFVICDAGGGTVDLASYTIESLEREPHKPVQCRLAGAAVGSGSLCGSNFLNRIFQAYLQEKLKTYPGWTPDCMIEATRMFEERIKPNFTGSGNEKTIKLQGLKASRAHGIESNLLVLTTEELRVNVFDKVISKIEGLVSDQINNTQGPVTAVLLAGGFGKNPYLKRRLEKIETVRQNGIKVQLIENSDTAVARGALVAGLAGQGRTHNFDDDGGFDAEIPGIATTLVVSRIAGRHYGTSAYYDFETGKDPEERRISRDDGEKIEKIQWFARKGESIPDGKPMPFGFSKKARVQRGVLPHEACIPRVKIYACDKEHPATYKDEPSVRKIAEFKLDLRGLPIPTAWVRDKEFYVAHFIIEMKFHAASLSFCGVYGEGTPNAKRFPAVDIVF